MPDISLLFHIRSNQTYSNVIMTMVDIPLFANCYFNDKNKMFRSITL